jgi:hypothetical protein
MLMVLIFWRKALAKDDASHLPYAGRSAARIGATTDGAAVVKSGTRHSLRVPTRHRFAMSTSPRRGS